MEVVQFTTFSRHCTFPSHPSVVSGPLPVFSAEHENPQELKLPMFPALRLRKCQRMNRDAWIRGSDLRNSRFIALQNQFFISSLFIDNIKNEIGQNLLWRIERAHRFVFSFSLLCHLNFYPVFSISTTMQTICRCGINGIENYLLLKRVAASKSSRV